MALLNTREIDKTMYKVHKCILLQIHKIIKLLAIIINHNLIIDTHGLWTCIDLIYDSWIDQIRIWSK